jgi:hypothetical protein
MTEIAEAKYVAENKMHAPDSIYRFFELLKAGTTETTNDVVDKTAAHTPYFCVSSIILLLGK